MPRNRLVIQNLKKNFDQSFPFNFRQKEDDFCLLFLFKPTLGIRKNLWPPDCKNSIF